MEINICHLYPEVLNLYGDRGNIRVLEQRLTWRGIDVHVTPLKIGDHADLTNFDLFFIGGGQDFEQEVLQADLETGKDKEIIAAIEDGKTFLAICGGYQMLGTFYQTHDGAKINYLGAIDFYTVGADTRMIDNYCYRLGPESGGSVVVGFENHSGQTFLGEGVKPLGTVIRGGGNNGKDGTEGVRYKNVYGTYSHGPVLPKNPDFADELIKTTLRHKYGSFRDEDLMPLDDAPERLAHDTVYERILRGETGKD